MCDETIRSGQKGRGRGRDGRRGEESAELFLYDKDTTALRPATLRPLTGREGRWGAQRRSPGWAQPTQEAPRSAAGRTATSSSIYRAGHCALLPGVEATRVPESAEPESQSARASLGGVASREAQGNSKRG